MVKYLLEKWILKFTQKGSSLVWLRLLTLPVTCWMQGRLRASMSGFLALESRKTHQWQQDVEEFSSQVPAAADLTKAVFTLFWKFNLTKRWDWQTKLQVYKIIFVFTVINGFYCQACVWTKGCTVSAADYKIMFLYAN